MFVTGPITIPYHSNNDFVRARNIYVSHFEGSWGGHCKCISTTNPFLAMLAWVVILDASGNILFTTYPLKVEVGEVQYFNGFTEGCAEMRIYAAACTPDPNSSPPISCGWPILLAAD